MRSSRWTRLALYVVVASLAARLVAVPFHLAFDEHHHPHDAAHHAQHSHGHGHGHGHGHTHGDPAPDEPDHDDSEHRLELLAPRDGARTGNGSSPALIALPAAPAFAPAPAPRLARLSGAHRLGAPRGRPPGTDAPRGPPRA